MKTPLQSALAGLAFGYPFLVHGSIDIVTEDVVVTATRFEQTYLDKPVNMTVITREEIERSGARTVPDLLARTPGFVVRELFGNNAASATVDLRGFGAGADQNTLILVDGRRVNDIDLSGVQWSSIPVSAIERIEIVRGGGAVLYGDGAVAGVVNIITRAAETTQAEGGVTAGSFDTREGRVNGSIRAGSAGLSVSAHRLLSDGYRKNNENAARDLHADLRLRGALGQLGLKAGVDRQALRLPGARRVQPSAGVDELEADRRGTSTPLDFSTRDGSYATLVGSTDLEGANILAELGYRDKEQTSYFDFGGFPDYRNVDLSVWSFTPRARIPLTLFGRDSQLVAGTDFYAWDYRLARSNAPENISRPFNVVQATQHNAALYLLANGRIRPDTTVSAGWRAERMKIDASDLFDPAAPGGAFGSGAPAGSQEEHEQAYELGLRREFGSGLAFTAKGSRSFRFATVDEIYESSPSFTQEFQFLRPQVARTGELALEQRIPSSTWRIAVFHMDVRDEIHLDPFSTGVGNTNLPPSRRRGLEAEVSWRARHNLLLGATYTYTQARFREGAFDNNNVVIAGKTVPLVPEHRATLAAAIDLAPRAQLVLNGAYVGQQFMDNDEANDFGVVIPAYLVIDLQLTWRTGAWSLGMRVNNLLAEKYFNYAVRSQFVADRYNAYPLPERAIYMTAEYRFGR